MIWTVLRCSVSIDSGWFTTETDIDDDEHQHSDLKQSQIIRLLGRPCSAAERALLKCHPLTNRPGHWNRIDHNNPTSTHPSTINQTCWTYKTWTLSWWPPFGAPLEPWMSWCPLWSQIFNLIEKKGTNTRHRTPLKNRLPCLQFGSYDRKDSNVIGNIIRLVWILCLDLIDYM